MTSSSAPTAAPACDTSAWPETGPLAPHPTGTLLIRNVILYGEGDPVDVLVEDGTIAEIGPRLSVSADDVVDGDGGVLLPGLVDLHVHFR